MGWQIYLILNIIGIVISILFAFVYKKKWKGIKHYEKIRDKLTLKEEEPEEEPEYEGGFIGNLIGAFLVLIVGFNLAPTISNAINTSTINATATSASSTILGLTTLFYCLGIAVVAITLGSSGLRKGGLI